MAGMWKGILVFAITYALSTSQRLRFIRVDRPAGALTGAVFAVAVGAISADEAAKAVDHTTIILLFAVMGMGAFLSLDGFFERVGKRIVSRARTPRRLVGITIWGAGVLSAIVTNDAVCVLLAPLVVDWVERYRLPRGPLLLALATGANTGSVATLVGNPQNMLCGSLGHLRFAPFALHLAPVALVGLALNHLIVLLVYRRELTASDDQLRLSETPGLLEPLFTRRSAITLAVILGTVVVYTAGAPLSFTALGGFVVLLLVHREEPGGVWKRIDWSILLFFGALFVAVAALARSGIADWAFSKVPLVTSSAPGYGDWLRASAIFLVGSNVVTNVPFILVVEEHMHRLPDAVLGWELLAMAATFAGNLTLLGSVANVIVAEKARPIGGLGFYEYLRCGLPVATVTTVVGAVMLVAMR